MCGRTRLEGAQKRDSHQDGVIFPIFETERTGAAELEFVGIALIAAVAAHDQSIEVIDPLPDESMQILPNHRCKDGRQNAPTRTSSAWRLKARNRSIVARLKK